MYRRTTVQIPIMGIGGREGTEGAVWRQEEEGGWGGTLVHPKATFLDINRKYFVYTIPNYA